MDDWHMGRRPSEMAGMKQVGVRIQGNGKDMIVLGGWRRGVEGLGKGGGGGLGRKVSKVVVGLGGWKGLVGWVLAPSTGRLPREGGSLEGAAPSRGRTTYPCA